MASAYSRSVIGGIKFSMALLLIACGSKPAADTDGGAASNEPKQTETNQAKADTDSAEKNIKITQTAARAVQTEKYECADFSMANSGNITVTGGALDAAWDWGEYTPAVLPKDEQYNDVGILVRMPYEFNTATFTGGTTLLDTGFAGNTALLLKGTLTIGDSMEVTGATLTFQDGDKPVFTGMIPDGVPYKLIYEAWQTDGEGLSSQEWFNNEDHLATWGGKLISTFDKNKTYTCKLYLTTTAAGSDAGCYFGTNTKLKINGTLYSYRLVNVDPDYDSSGRIYTFWAYTDPGSNTDSPETGDNSSIVLWLSLLFVGGAPVVLRKKREHR